MALPGRGRGSARPARGWSALLVGVGGGGGSGLVLLARRAICPTCTASTDYRPAARRRRLRPRRAADRRVLRGAPPARPPRRDPAARVARLRRPPRTTRSSSTQGIDFASIAARRVDEPARGRRDRQGASTITQQMVKSLLLTPERTYTRKIARDDPRAAHRAALHEAGDPVPLPEPDLLRAAAPTASARPRAPTSASTVGELDVSRGRAARRAAEGAVAVLAARATRSAPSSAAATCSTACSRTADRRADLRARARGTPPVLARAARARRLRGRRLLHRGGAALPVRGARRRARARGRPAHRDDARRSSSSSAAVAAVRAGLEALDHRQGYRGPLRRVRGAEIEGEVARLGAENALDPALAPLADGSAAPRAW